MTATVQAQEMGVVLKPSPLVEAAVPSAVTTTSIPARSSVATPVDRSEKLRKALSGLWLFLKETRGHGVWIAVWSVIGIAGTLWSPFLFDQPVLLMALAPRTAFVLLAADDVSLMSFVLLGTARLGMTDASWYVVGRRSPGRTILERAPSQFAPLRLLMKGTNLLCSWLSRHNLLAGLVLFLRPNARYLGVAGAYNVCPRVAAVSSVVGTIAYLVAIHEGIGFFLG
ncbi:MAG: hypothetical protein ACR2P0_12200 [Acidimicrobiales bacterium]